ncbi:hypothetical protein ACJMK2_035673, partial [Sinanodonta woodiana]
LLVEARDNGSPARLAYNTFRVVITRNLYTPQWRYPNDTTAYRLSTSVLETFPFDQTMLTLSGTDADMMVPYNKVVYTLVGDTPAPLYFNVVPSTGDIRLHSALYLDTSPSYI